MQNTDIVILGGGMVGLSLAHQISERFPDLSITVIDKESELGGTVPDETAVCCTRVFTTPLERQWLRSVCREQSVCAPGVSMRDYRCLHAAR